MRVKNYTRTLQTFAVVSRLSRLAQQTRVSHVFLVKINDVMIRSITCYAFTDAVATMEERR